LKSKHTVEADGTVFDVPPKPLAAVFLSILVVELLFGRPDSNISYDDGISIGLIIDERDS
jgi:hypothetical protein